ncbi:MULTISPECIES: tRNA (adenine(22)-N(1))-methyltransferase [unclassified Clostridium]|uniref:tRNA (adenine(22)-N(1))-methyltransferase n=1 Tax=unclassified Clostridium TaxID=2614128 RepID=UPI000ED5DB44|nr:MULTISPECIES: class I SAM-dependent methyltransferase [unclassified Clostridium]HCQ91321.1 SAM-dependent methyltransferase [Clostridium sp.]
MNLSDRLKTVGEMIKDVNTIVDVGTDHAYIPIYLIKNNIIEKAIASDINSGPVEKAKKNVSDYNLQDKISCRLGGGLTTVKPKEVDAAIIAGMGGNLIRDIIEESKEVFKNLDYAILQPVQNPEVLREYIYKSGYKIIDEELVKEEDKFYEIFKVKYDNKIKETQAIYYEVSETLIKKKHPVMKEYLVFKLDKYTKIYSGLNQETESAIKRKEQLEKIIIKLKEFLQCL